MGIYYFDANAVVKYYILEPGSTWIREIVNAPEQKNLIFISDATITEYAAALSVLFRTGRIRRSTRDGAFRAFIHHTTTGLFRTLPLGTEDFWTAAQLTQAYPLKGYDAVQLAIALRQTTTLSRKGVSMIFTSGDKALINAARGENLLAENPFDHVSPDDLAYQA